MKVYCRETDSTLKADIKITDENILTVHIYDIAHNVSDKEYVEVGKHGIALESHMSYGVLYERDNGYLIRNANNIQYRSNIKIVPINQITMGSRMKYEELENRYGGMIIFQIDTNNISKYNAELQIQLYRLQRDNTIFNLPSSMKIEYENLDMDIVFRNGSKRHTLWDTYSITINGVEYKESEFISKEKAIPVLDMKNCEYIDVIVQKYSNNFGKALNRDEDNEVVFIETTGGVSNCQRINLKNGVGKFRWYHFGFNGYMKFKLGWRWYSGIADIRFNVVNAE